MESDAGPSEHSFHGLILIYIIKEADSFAYSDFLWLQPLCRDMPVRACRRAAGGWNEIITTV